MFVMNDAGFSVAVLLHSVAVLVVSSLFVLLALPAFDNAK